MKSTFALSKVVNRSVSHSTLLFMGLIFLTPFIWMVLVVLKSPDQIFSNPFGLPTGLGSVKDNIHTAFTAVPMTRFLMNGALVVSILLILQLTVAIPAAYALAKFKFIGRQMFMMAVVAGLCIPIQIPMLPVYIGLAYSGMLDSYFSLIFPFVISPFAIFMLRQQIKSFPDEIIQAARLDGFSESGIILRLILPEMRPVIAAFSVFSVTAHWNDLYWPLITVSSQTMATPPLGMLYFRDGDMGTNYGALMAGAIITVLPVMILFLIAQRNFIKGLSVSGHK